MVELLGPIATTAFQALAPVRFSRPEAVDGHGKPKKIVTRPKLRGTRLPL